MCGNCECNKGRLVFLLSAGKFQSELFRGHVFLFVGLVNIANAMLNYFQTSTQINAKVRTKLVLSFVVEMVNVIVVCVSVI